MNPGMQQTSTTRSQRRHRPAARGGFTLVELLVVAGLTVMMMSMFATVFQLATGSITTQRGIAENDQRARTLTIVMRGDLEHRTFKRLVPYSDETTNAAEVAQFPVLLDFDDRKGYFYISENDPDVDTDDVLQFTVELDDDEFFYGRSWDLRRLTDQTAYHRNQPEWDDGRPGDDTGNSKYAEVSYFLRNGVLYRRVLLVRDVGGTRDGSGPNDGFQPEDNNGNDFFNPDNDGMSPLPQEYTRNFWEDFDYSAHYDTVLSPARATFKGSASLDNIGATEFLNRPLGVPKHRFGHHHTNGTPREYGDSTVASTFIGRYTHEETSSADFGYPARIPSGGSPMDDGTAITLTNGVVQEYAGGSRRAEDILMTNVHSFDIKVWDDAINQFVDIGSSSIPVGGIFAAGNNQNSSYGPKASGNNVFDTWHPRIDLDNDATGTPFEPAPYRPDLKGPDGEWGGPGDDDGDGLANDLDPDEYGFVGSDDFVGLRGIQVTLRYYDISSSQLRQLTLVHSLLPND